MPRKTGMTPTYRPIRVKLSSVLLSGVAVSAAASTTTSNGTELAVKSVQRRRLGHNPGIS